MDTLRVTITGPQAVGKTRVASAIVSHLLTMGKYVTLHDGDSPVKTFGSKNDSPASVTVQQ